MTDPTVTSGVQSEDRRTHVERLNPAFAPSKGPAMTPEQFAELKALLTTLLTPGYELSKLYMAQAQAQMAEATAAAAAAQAATDAAIAAAGDVKKTK